MNRKNMLSERCTAKLSIHGHRQRSGTPVQSGMLSPPGVEGVSVTQRHVTV